MWRTTTASTFLLAALVSAGCIDNKQSGNKEEFDFGPDVKAANTPAEVYRASAELVNALADVLTEIKDRDSATKARPKIEVIERKGKILTGKFEELHIDEKLHKELEQ